METNYQKETKRPQQIIKMAKLHNNYKEPDDTYEPKRRVKIQSTFNSIDNVQQLNEDSSTFNGIDYFENLQQKKSNEKKKTPLKLESVSSILAKVSLRERFSNLHLITSIDKMLMHSKYSNLCHFFKEIDEILLFLQNQQKPPFFNTIYELLSHNSKIKITQQIIQQILEIFPNAYDVNWSLNEKLIREDQSDLMIKANIKSHVQLVDRLTYFQQLMFKYIQKNGEYIGLAILPKNPFQQILKDQFEMNNSLKKEIQQQTYENEIQSEIYKEPIYSKLSQNLIEKLKSKKKPEIVLNDCKTPKQQLIALSQLIHQYYHIRDVSNMFLINVVKYSFNSLKHFILDENQIKAYIDQLITLCPYWMQLIENQNGSILRLNKEIDIPSIIRSIEYM
ncbi:unnamed protein product [Paramecium pentaurelia]|uniref:CDT1 Geminin-binding domain-containing protein n=1 Tax=Paramecium pentaurelia TaxID=43138 RepID=A0A8S1WVH5_9CILI|nr:unnamed protein product [Paramecium pentaurelia]